VSIFYALSAVIVASASQLKWLHFHATDAAAAAAIFCPAVNLLPVFVS